MRALRWGTEWEHCVGVVVAETLGKLQQSWLRRGQFAEKACGPGETFNDPLENVDYKKPNCIGNPMFSFFRDRMSPEEREFA